MDSYESVAKSHGIDNRDFITRIRQFFRFRHSILRKQVGKHLVLADSFPCSVSGPKGVVFEIDGYPYPAKPGYSGWYFSKMPIGIEIIAAQQKDFSHWLVNGKKLSDTRKLVVYPVSKPTFIEAVFSANAVQ
jgi:hypothetical protein